jgi:hypothetical protein
MGTQSDWPEDAAFENGNYQCQCLACDVYFVGLKRRQYCRKCQKGFELAGCWHITKDYSNSDPHRCRKPCVPGTMQCEQHQV